MTRHLVDGRRVAQTCAARAYDTLGRGACAGDLAGHYARAGYDVLAITDHWRISDEDAVDGMPSFPASS